MDCRVDVATEKRCQCGYLRDEHDPQALSRGKRYSSTGAVWSFYDDTEKRPTDAYGTILFPTVNSIDTPRSAQVSSQTSSSIHTLFIHISHLYLL